MRFGLLYSKYKPSRWWWEMFEILRRLLVVSVIPVLMTRGSDAVWCSIFVLNITAMLAASVTPFAQRRISFVYFVSLVCTLLILVVGLGMRDELLDVAPGSAVAPSLSPTPSNPTPTPTPTPPFLPPPLPSLASPTKVIGLSRDTQTALLVLLQLLPLVTGVLALASFLFEPRYTQWRRRRKLRGASAIIRDEPPEDSLLRENSLACTSLLTRLTTWKIKLPKENSSGQIKTSSDYGDGLILSGELTPPDIRVSSCRGSILESAGV